MSNRKGEQVTMEFVRGVVVVADLSGLLRGP